MRDCFHRNSRRSRGDHERLRTAKTGNSRLWLESQFLAGVGVETRLSWPTLLELDCRDFTEDDEEKKRTCQCQHKRVYPNARGEGRQCEKRGLRKDEDQPELCCLGTHNHQICKCREYEELALKPALL